jgi:hypothetical protein
MPGILILLAALLSAAALGRGAEGIAIRPGDDGVFTYEDDFATPRCLTDAFLTDTGVEIWEAGALQGSGPARNRTLTYRFHGERSITDCSVTVEQKANGPNLGGQTCLYLSTNGLDWSLVANSATQTSDANGWQGQPFQVSGEATRPCTGGAEIWLRLVLDNHSGLKTNASNLVDKLTVKLTLGAAAAAAADPQADLRRAWGIRRQDRGWSAIALDAADPEPQRAPHYYEDADGWLRRPGETPHLDTAEASGFRVQRVYLSTSRSPLSLATFVTAERETGGVLARITLQATRDGSRRLQVKWDGLEAATFDAASFLPQTRVFFVNLTPCPAGRHELRLAPADQGVVTVQEIALIGPPGLAWTAKPALRTVVAPTVLSATYLPDPAPPAASQVVEGRQAQQGAELVFAGLQRLYAEHEQFGALRVLVRNPGPEPVRLREEVQLNGKPIAASYVDFAKSDWDARGVVWYRLQPQLLRAGECGELYVRFRRRPTGEAAQLTLPCENAGSAEIFVPYQPPALTLDYVTPGKSGTELYVYLRTTGAAAPGALGAVALDGVELADAKVYGGDFREGVALVVARLQEPLAPLSFHVVTARAATGDTVGAQFRVLPWFFPRSSIHVPSELCREMNMNLGMWHFRSLEECRTYALPTTTNTERMFDAHEQVRFILGPDEPDANDNRGGGYDRGLGSQARRLQDSGWTELVASQAPQVATWVIMNGTTRPLNWNVYGQFADVSCFDPYPVNFYGGDHAYVRESLGYARQCGQPRRMMACLEAYGWSAGQGVPAKSRGPLREEWRQNVVQALGCGAKGLTSWVYAAGAGGWQLNDPVKQEMARVNALIARLEDLLLLGTPVDWAQTDAGTVLTGVVGEERWPKERVWAGALLCGPDAIVVAVANHIPAGKPEPPTVTPARDVTVSVRLPTYLAAVSAVEVTEDGETAVPCTVADGQARVQLDSVVSGRILVLRRP